MKKGQSIIRLTFFYNEDYQDTVLSNSNPSACYDSSAIAAHDWMQIGCPRIYHLQTVKSISVILVLFRVGNRKVLEVGLYIRFTHSVTNWP